MLMTEQSVSAIDPDVFPAHLDGKTGDSHGRIAGNLAIGRVILPPVPGACQELSCENALAQRSPAMQTRAVNGVELALDVGDGEGLAVDLKLANRSGGNFIF